MVVSDDVGDAVGQFNNDPVDNGNLVDNKPVDDDDQDHKYELVNKED